LDPNLQGLYPFLANEKLDSADVEGALMTSIECKAEDHAKVIAAFFASKSREVLAAARTIAESCRRGGRILAMGNGGSSCDAAHVAVEFLHPVTAGRPSLGALNLANDMAMVTAVGNDVGQDHIFVRQVIAHGRRGDCLLGLSTSGNSKNLILALRKAKELGISTIGLAGGNGGEMARAGLDHCLVVPTDSIHRTQECHVVIYHILWDLVHTLLADDRGAFVDQGAHPTKEALT
jgi:D-sedoheptulose 7-phosphate isomerase